MCTLPVLAYYISSLCKHFNPMMTSPMGLNVIPWSLELGRGPFPVLVFKRKKKKTYCFIPPEIKDGGYIEWSAHKILSIFHEMYPREYRLKTERVRKGKITFQMVKYTEIYFLFSQLTASLCCKSGTGYFPP